VVSLRCGLVVGSIAIALWAILLELRSSLKFLKHLRRQFGCDYTSNAVVFAAIFELNDILHRLDEIFQFWEP
jgi:uncharacterized PurR-regulated membrane protein YhhQ (DUF165 family)